MKYLILMVAFALSVSCAFGQSKATTKDTTQNKSVTRDAPFQVKYDYVFKRNTDGSFSPNYPVQVNGELMGSGVPFTAGTSFGGVDVGSYEGHDLLIDTIKGVVLIRKFIK